MYPTKFHPAYGVFVKNFVDSLKENNFVVNLSVIKGKKNNKLTKLLDYIGFVATSVWKIMFSKYDVLYIHYIAHSVIPLSLVRKIRKPLYILNAHGEDLLLNKKNEKLIERFARKTIENANLIVVPSKHFEQIVIERYPQVSCFISPSGGVNRNIFFSNHSNFESNIIGYVSRIDENKGWDVFIKSANILSKKYPKLSFHIYGDGNQKDQMINLIHSLKLHDVVLYQGSISQKQLGDKFREFDLFIFPTMLNESLGLVGLEAMSCGTPVIGSKIPSLQNYIQEHKNGYTFEIGNYQELSEKIEHYISLTENEKSKMCNFCLESSDEYDSVSVAEMLIKKIHEVIDNKNYS
jgi:glycosyltransferase involved in cell wall biosynthesis